MLPMAVLFFTVPDFPDICYFHNSEEILIYDRSTDAPTTLTLLNALSGNVRRTVAYRHVRI